MRLPFLQVTSETWTKAQVLGGLLKVSQADAMMAILNLWRWALELGPPNEAPTGRIISPRAPVILAAAVGMVQGEPAALCDALVDVGLLEVLPDGLRVRGLDRYAATWKRAADDRARKAAARARTAEDVPRKSRGAARAVRRKTQMETETQKEPSPSEREPLQLEALPQTHEEQHTLQALWNELRTAALPHWREMTPAREAAARERLKERTRSEWREIIERITNSDFCNGKNDRNWVASPDWLLKPGTAAKVLEGAYDNRTSAQAQRKPEAGVRPGGKCAVCSAAAEAAPATGGELLCYPCMGDWWATADASGWERWDPQRSAEWIEQRRKAVA